MEVKASPKQSVVMCCPFCGGDAKLQSKTERSGYDEYMRYIDSFYVSCSQCGARTKGFDKKPFNEMTDYTVQDFRDNNALSAKEEDKYEHYCKQLEQDTLTSCNLRT